MSFAARNVLRLSRAAAPRRVATVNAARFISASRANAVQDTANKKSVVREKEVPVFDQTRAFPFLLLLCKCETLSPFGKRNKITSKSPSLIKPVRRTLASLDNQREKDTKFQNPSNAH